MAESVICRACGLYRDLSDMANDRYCIWCARIMSVRLGAPLVSAYPAPLPPVSPADEAAATSALLTRMATDPPAPTWAALHADFGVLARIVGELHARLLALEADVARRRL